MLRKHWLKRFSDLWAAKMRSEMVVSWNEGTRCKGRDRYLNWHWDIAWAHVPFPRSYNLDVFTFRKSLKLELSNGGRLIANKDYADDMMMTSYTIVSPIVNVLHSILRARREALNKWIRQFYVLGSKFSHPRKIHGIYIHAVARINQIAFQDKPLSDIES